MDFAQKLIFLNFLPTFGKWHPDKQSVAVGAAMSVPPKARSAEIASSLNFRKHFLLSDFLFKR